MYRHECLRLQALIVFIFIYYILRPAAAIVPHEFFDFIIASQAEYQPISLRQLFLSLTINLSDNHTQRGNRDDDPINNCDAPSSKFL